MSCELNIPTVKGLEDNILTVGRIFQLKCAAPIPEDFNFEAAHLVLPESDKLAFKIFKTVAQDKNTLLFEATLYRAGEWKAEDLVLDDGKHKISLGKFETQVQSVIPEGVQAEGYGPIGPLIIPLPWIYIFIISSAILFLVGTLGLQWRRRWQRNSLLKRLREYETSLSPLQQFHAESRRWQRENSFFHDPKINDESLLKVLKEIDHHIRVYFIRRFQIPALEWSQKLILADLKKYHRRIYDEHRDIIKKWFTEIGKALSPQFQLKAQDVVQFRDEARKLLEKLDSPIEGKR